MTSRVGVGKRHVLNSINHSIWFTYLVTLCNGDDKYVEYIWETEKSAYLKHFNVIR